MRERGTVRPDQWSGASATTRQHVVARRAADVLGEQVGCAIPASRRFRATSLVLGAFVAGSLLDLAAQLTGVTSGSTFVARILLVSLVAAGWLLWRPYVLIVATATEIVVLRTTRLTMLAPDGTVLERFPPDVIREAGPNRHRDRQVTIGGRRYWTSTQDDAQVAWLTGTNLPV